MPTLNSPLKIVVTGATGFVGANLCKHFLKQGHEVIAVTGSTRSNWRLQALASSNAKLTQVAVDLGDEAALRTFIARTQPQAWIGCAAYGAYPGQTDAPKIYRVCFDSVRWTLDALGQVPGFKAFVQMGSQSEYGLNCTAPSETSATIPDSDYAVAKVAATAYTQFCGKKKDFPGWVFRLYSVYGPMEDPSRLILKLLLHARDGKLPPLVNPRISRDFIYIVDVCGAVDAVLAKSGRLARGEVYNIGTGRCTTLEMLVEAATERFKIPVKPEWGSMANRRWDHTDWYANPAKAKRDLAWNPGIDLRTGLGQTMEWIQANPDQIQAALQQSVTN
jgi:dolichol-phosphate mannosyltransferase